MADRLKLAAGLRNLPETAREDLAGREQDIQRGKTVELLRRAGKEMYENPIVNTAIGLSPVLGDIQAGVEAYRSAQAGDWGNAGLNAMGMLPFIPMLGKTVWHGSPHSFEKFDLSKIGTGEGAQAYGHGLYLAESPKTAEHYKYAGETVKYTPTLEKFTNGPNYFIDESGRYMKARDWVRNDVPVEVPKEEYLQKFNEVQAAHEAQPTGSLYKVDLPDEQIAKMLDWDKPLSEQPQAVQDALHQAALVNFETNIGPKASGEIGDLGWTKNVKSMSGEDLYRKLTEGAFTNEMFLQGTKKGEAQAVISDKLRQAGIPGIQYLDQVSRGAGEGTRNYVVFSDEIPQILERNGQPIAQALRDYRGSHTAPGPEFGAPLHDLTGGGQMYPEDVYSRNAVQYYGTGDTKLDKESFAIAQRMRNKPEEMIDIYRAVPNEGDITSINAGDWVTINPNYAKQHGESNLPEGYKILQQKVPVKSVWTNADSIHEYGYWPE